MSGATATEPLSGLADPRHRRRTALLRLAIGVVHGLMLWALIRADEDGDWPARHPILYVALIIACGMTPVVLLAGAGRMTARALAIWGAVVAATVAGLAAWTASNQTPPPWSSGPEPTFPLVLALLILLFVSHHLLLPGLKSRRWIAAYPDYFDTAWKAGVQLALSLGFVGALWALLGLGAALFNVIGLRFLGDLITSEWFAAPVTTIAFALAVQLTDVRDGLIRGVRTVALMLLGWLLPVMTVLVAGFLIALPFTGLDGLWETGSSTALMLAATAALIVLINAAYHDGEERPARALAWAAPAAAILLTPLVLLALLGLALRIGQHGLTPERIFATACALIGGVYAAGYGWAAVATLRRRAWMKPLERTNVAAAVAVILAILALFSPVADPWRLSVADQTSRLARGAVSAEDFDYAFLRFDAGKRGERALARLARHRDPEIARRAREMQTVENRYDLDPATGAVERETPVIEPWPDGRALPPGFTSAVPTSDPRSVCSKNSPCLAQRIDLDGDGQEEILVASAFDVTLWVADTAGWSSHGSYRAKNCDGEPRVTDPRAAMRAGALSPRPVRWPDLSFGGTPSQLDDTFRCRRLVRPADATP